MPRQNFERELKELQDDVLALGSMVEQALTDSVDALKGHDFGAARRIIAGDRAINEKRFDIEADALALIATQQPMAGDVRTLAAVLEIVTELERIGDYAKGISRINLRMGAGPFLKPLTDIPLMCSIACEQLRRALAAFIHRDVEAARAIPREDDIVDGLYNQVYRELLTIIFSDLRTLDQANFILWIAHNLERANDRVTNICERVIFMVTGEMLEMDADEDETLA
jgi:phosphate transport system protein